MWTLLCSAVSSFLETLLHLLLVLPHALLVLLQPLWFLPHSLVLWPLFLRVLASVSLNIYSVHSPWPKAPHKVILPKWPPLVSTFLLSTCLINAFTISIWMLLMTSLHRSQIDSSSHLQVGTKIPNPSKSYWVPFHPHYHSLNAGPHYSEPKVPPNFLICLHFYSFRVKHGEEHQTVEPRSPPQTLAWTSPKAGMCAEAEELFSQGTGMWRYCRGVRWQRRTKDLPILCGTPYVPGLQWPQKEKCCFDISTVYILRSFLS